MFKQDSEDEDGNGRMFSVYLKLHRPVFDKLSTNYVLVTEMFDPACRMSEHSDIGWYHQSVPTFHIFSVKKEGLRKRRSRMKKDTILHF